MELIKTEYPLKGMVDSRIGGRSENQDNYGFCDAPIGSVVVVCDGMGGMQGGRYASMIAVKSILDFIRAVPESADPSDTLTNAIRKAHADILQTGHQNPELYGMGTTVTAAIFSKQCAVLAHVGDSRIYQLRGRKKVFRTFDHSMVFEMVKSGILTEEQARLSDKSNIILRALGVYGEIVPEIEVRPYLKGDRFVLCTDGFWGSMPEPRLIEHLAGKRIDLVLEKTADLVDRIGHKKGGNHDNLTAAIVEMKTNSLMKEKMSKTLKITLITLSVLLLASVALNVYLLTKPSGTEPVQSEETSSETLPSDDANEPLEISGESADSADSADSEIPGPPETAKISEQPSQSVQPAGAETESKAESEQPNAEKQSIEATL